MPETLTQIEHIISTTKCHDENFLTDSKEAAKKIMEYLKEEKLIVVKGKVEVY